MLASTGVGFSGLLLILQTIYMCRTVLSLSLFSLLYLAVIVKCIFLGLNLFSLFFKKVTGQTEKYVAARSALLAKYTFESLDENGKRKVTDRVKEISINFQKNCVLDTMSFFV